MIHSYQYSEWERHCRSDKLHNADNFSSCCGSRYYEKATRLCNSKGIALYPGKMFTEGEHAVNTVKHVHTPDGIITLVVRTVW